MSGTTISMFPKSEAQGLALEFLRAQNLQGKSPSEIAKIYYDAFDEIQKYLKEQEKSGVRVW